MKRAPESTHGVLSSRDQERKTLYARVKEFIWIHRQGIQFVFTFFSLILLVIAICLSYLTFRESQQFGSTMIAQMDTLSNLFSRVNQQISYLPTSVSRFDTTIQELNQGISNQQGEFQRSIGGLQRNIDAFSKGISDYGMTLAKIVSASDKQLALLDSRQKLLEKELMRTPKLKLQVKECTKDSLGRLHITPQILNEGDEVATYCAILLRVPAEFDFESHGFTVWDSTAGIQSWGGEFPSFIPYGQGQESRPLVFNPRMMFTIRFLPNAKLPYEFDYLLYHNKGTDEGRLVIHPTKCR